MSDVINVLESFLGRAIESGHINKIKCLECGAEMISVSLDEEDDFMCGECESDFVEVEKL